MKMISESKLKEIRRSLYDDDGYTRVNNPHFDLIFEEAFKSGMNHVNNGVLDDVIGSKLTTSDAFKATLEWIESDDVWIEDEQGNKVEGLKINGKNLKKYCEPYYL